MGIRALHMFGGEVVFVEVPGDEQPSESISVGKGMSLRGQAVSFPTQLKSDAQIYREQQAKNRVCIKTTNSGKIYNPYNIKD